MSNIDWGSVNPTVLALIDKIIENEGGYTDHKSDAGNWLKNDSGEKVLVGTNWGIAAPTLKHFWKRDPSREEMENLDIMVAKEIYLTNFYLKPKMNLIPQSVQANVFDMGVNAGPSRGIKILQSALNGIGFDVGSVDGMMGQGTAQKAVDAEQAGHDLNNIYSDYRIAFYKDLAERKPKNKAFLNGWINRANHMRERHV